MKSFENFKFDFSMLVRFPKITAVDFVLIVFLLFSVPQLQVFFQISHPIANKKQNNLAESCFFSYLIIVVRKSCAAGCPHF